MKHLIEKFHNKKLQVDNQKKLLTSIINIKFVT